MTTPVVQGYVLAGGESSRMQRSDLPQDKALLLFEGETFLQRALRTIAQVCAGATILCGTGERCGRLGMYGRTVLDRVPRCGPLGGLDAALQDTVRAGGDAVLIMPVDMPRLPAKVLQFLLDQATSSHAAVACLRVEDSVQPLPAYVRVGAAAAVDAALESGDRKLLPVLRRIAMECGSPEGLYIVDAATCGSGPGETLDWFANVNTPDDLLSASQPGTLRTRLHLSKHGG